jgi:predicted GNAT superfamily acetyltransferase
MKNMSIRDAAEVDFPAIVELNAREVQHTSPMDLERLRYLDSISACHKVATVGDEVAAFLLAMKDHCGYVNDNYEWFAARYPQFLYVDRIVVSSEFQGHRLGSQLYQDLFQHARANRIQVVACEYNIVPLNGPSRIFHGKLGFREIGTQWIANGAKQVSMQAAEI